MEQVIFVFAIVQIILNVALLITMGIPDKLVSGVSTSIVVALGCVCSGILLVLQVIMNESLLFVIPLFACNVVILVYELFIVMKEKKKLEAITDGDYGDGFGLETE